MEHFVQMNVFAWIRTIFARIRTVFAHLIVGCAIRYPKIGSLRYMKIMIEFYLHKQKIEFEKEQELINAIKVRKQAAVVCYSEML